MTEGGIGRLLLASLHQAITEVMPTRLEFYETWLTSSAMRDGRVGRGALGAAVSFLRGEGTQYAATVSRAGALAAEWTVAGWSPARRSLFRRTPEWLRARLLLRHVRDLMQTSLAATEVTGRWRRGAGEVSLVRSVFCDVRDPMPGPMCGYYASVVESLMNRCGLDVEVSISECRAYRGKACTLAIATRTQGVRAA